MNKSIFAFVGILLFTFISFCSSQVTILERFTLFPDTQYVKTFPADGISHQMRIETVELTRNMRVGMGTVFPLLNIDLFGITTQAGIGASVHYEVKPQGQAHIISDDYYVDYIILDFFLAQNYFLRFASGHTSHHLSDNWYERLGLSSAFHYARDYVKLYGVYSDQRNIFLYVGLNYGYVVTIKKRMTKPWNFQAGGEIDIAALFDFMKLFYAGDGKVRQETGFAATISHQLGIKFVAPNSRNLRVAFQFRHGLDERGQFFPQHRKLGTLGIYFDL